MAEQLGRYILDRKIAAGGMAEVFLARQSGPGGFEKLCVIKRMLPALGQDEHFVRMFLDEAKLAAYLNHPNIAQIFDFGEVSGTYYLAMEYVPGATLRQIVKEHTRRGEFLPAHLVARLVSQAAVALDYAHHATDGNGEPLHIIHRDVSPQNILLATTGVVKLIDFGVAKAASASQKTATGIIKGKFAYMSPEQLRGKPLDARSDVYGLGFVLYELLAGARAIQGANDAVMMEAALKRRFDPIEQRRPDVPAALREIVERALAKEREDRFPTAAELSAALERYLVKGAFTVTGTELANLLSAEARVPLRVTGEEQPLVTPSDGAVAVQKPVTQPSEPFWDGRAGAPDQRTVVDPAFQVPAPAVPPGLKTRAAPGATTQQPTAVLSAGERAVPRPDLPARRPDPESQAAVVASSAESSASLVRRGVGRTAAPFVLAALTVATILGGMAWWLFAGDAPAPPPAPATVAEPPKVESKPEPVAEKPAEVSPRIADQPPAVEQVKAQPPPAQSVKRHASTKPAVAVDGAKALLQLASVPATSIFIDGQPHGRSPVQAKLSPGDHQVVFRDDQLGLKHSRTVRLERGEERREEWRAAKGKVAFRVVPFGEVFLEQKWLGLTPLSPVELYEGEHLFRFVNKDTGRSESRTVTVLPNQEVVVKVDLRGGG